MIMLLAALPLLASAAMTCTAIDGDTLRCGREHIRLIGIDSPEMPGHCRRGRVCAPGSGPAAQAAMARIVHRQPVKLLRFGVDRYGRTLAIAYAGAINLSCAQLASGHAIYKPNWDHRRRIARECAR